jgi:hypothetical protein
MKKIQYEFKFYKKKVGNNRKFKIWIEIPRAILNLLNWSLLTADNKELTDSILIFLGN